MTVRKRGNKWHYDFMIDGVRYRGSVKTARTKAQAEHAELQVKLKAHEGVYGKPKGCITMKEFVEARYIPWTKANKRSWKIDMSRLKPILSFFGNKRLREVNPFLIEKFKIERKNTPIVSKTKVKPRSVGAVNRELRLLSRIFKLAIANHEVAENPCQKVSILKGEQGRTRYLLPDEEERLMAVLTGERSHLRDMIVLVLNTGLRISEVFNLKPEHIDLHRNAVYIKETKNDEDREVPLNDTSRGLLIKLLDQCQKQGNKYLFTNPLTEARYTTIKTAWNTACRKAGITGLRFHDLRHTFGTRAADAGVPLNAICDVMGHKSISMTERYAHATNEGKRRAVEAVQKAIVTNLSQRRVEGGY
jgi:integrase